MVLADPVLSVPAEVFPSDQVVVFPSDLEGVVLSVPAEVFPSGQVVVFPSDLEGVVLSVRITAG